MSTQHAQTPGVQEATPTTNGVTILARIKPGQVDAVRAAVTERAKTWATPDNPLSKTAKVHFLRFTILDNNTLLFASHFDGDLDDYLDDFFTMSNGGEGFDDYFRHCEGWPGIGDQQKFVNFWKSHAVENIVLYSYYPGVTCKEIEKALRIRRNLEAVLQDFQ